MTMMVEESGRGDFDPREVRWQGTPAELAMGLQLLRASSLTSTRLQLALARRDRQVAVVALDTLAAIDSEIEGLVDRLTVPGATTPELAAIEGWLAEEKAAVAADKLSLACDARGPGLVSPPDRLSAATKEADAIDRAADEVADEDADERPPTRRWWLLGLVALMLAVLAVGLIIALDPSHAEAASRIAEISHLFGGN